MLFPDIISTAEFSPCRAYRYTLTRTWDESIAPLIVIGLNPSTADERIDDPTIRRCISFAKREKCGGLVMLNIFAFRATDPDVMKAQDDPVGPENDDWISHECVRDPDSIILAAWGVHGAHLSRADAVCKLLALRRIKCLGVTKDGHPKHPLYIAADTPLEDYLR